MEARLNLFASPVAAFNRANVIVRQPAGDYEPGQFD
jgi:hypothetical protein